MAMRALAAALLLAGPACATELTKETWDAAVAGKSVFVKFQAPWWGHCKKLKPDWDTLMAEYKDSKTAVIADVDCTADGKSLCDANGVRGYPTIKYGDPANMEDYKGGRTLAAMKEFAASNLGPSCGPAHLDLCDAEKKAEIEKFQAMPAADLEKAVADKTAEMETLESDFKTFVDGLQKSYQEASDKKEKDVEAVKASGLGLMKAVAAHAKTQKTEL